MLFWGLGVGWIMQQYVAVFFGVDITAGCYSWMLCFGVVFLLGLQHKWLDEINDTGQWCVSG